MDHSIAAKYAARPAARFVRPSTRVRERRLGLRPSGSFQAPGVRSTELRGPELAPADQAPGQLARDPPGGVEGTGDRSDPTDRDHGVGQVRAPRHRPTAGRRIGAVVRLRTSTATSAGGIVVRHEKGQPWLVVGSRRRERDGRTWTLPKGTPHPGETREETALREVQEETGLKVQITGTLDSIEYWFVQSGTRIHKTVHYFLMEPAGGDLAKHDHEFDEVRWVSFEFGRHDADLRDRADARRARRRRPQGTRRAADRGRGRTLRREALVTDAADPPIHLTPLNDAHQELGARLIEFSGWLMPVQYGSIIEEHRTVRTKAGLFDLSHMGELYVEGPEAGLALAAALVSDPPSLAVGRAHYSMMTTPDGGIVDDLIVYRLGRRAVPRRSQRRQRGRRVRRPGRAPDRLPRGPRRPLAGDRPAGRPGSASAGLLAPLTDVDLGALRYYAAVEGTVAGIPGLVARTGYTGEDGFEVFVDTAQTVPLWNALLAAVRDAGGLPIGLGARDTLRLEAGMPLYGNELDLETQSVPGRPRPGGQARQDRRLRRARRPREDRQGRSIAAPRRPDDRGSRDRPPRLSGLVRRPPDRRRDQRDAVAHAGRADRDGVRRTR